MRKLSALEYLAGVEPTENAQASAPTNLHVITAEVSSKSEDGTARVSMDGLVYSEDESQEIDIDTLGGLEEGDTVTILLAGESGHGMTPLALGSVGSIDRIVANVDEIEANYVRTDILEANYAHVTEGVIDNATIGYADVNGLEANYASIGDLNVANGKISNLETNKANVTDLTAANARIDTLETNKADVTDLTAANARIDTLETSKADVTDLTAANARIDTLETSKADVDDLEANYAHVTEGVIDNATIGHADVNGLDANYVTTDFLNADVGWIQNGVIKDGSISSAMINDVSANKLTAGTINGSVINVTNLNADNITTGTINGQRIGEGSLSLSKLEEDVYTESEVDAKLSTMQAEIDGAIETWTGTAVPTLNNAPASSWTTAAVRDTHVGDVYFVVNSQSEQNGYNYRFTKSGNSYSWQLIKDSDVTNALQRITAAEGQITAFDSDISQLKTDTGTLTTKTTSLETRMSDAEDDILDKVDVTTFNEVSDTVDGHTQSISQMSQTLSNKADSSTVTSLTNRVSKNEQDISGINTTIGELETTVESKADGSTVETVSNKLNTVSDTVDGHTQAISSVQSTLSTKADSSAVSTLSTKVNTISDTVDGHTQTIGSIQTTQTTMQTTLDKTLVETTQLWYSKANTTAPAKPTSQVTSTSTAGNAWRTVVPAYNAIYPNYYYCYQWKYSDGTYGWSSVTRDIAMGESQATARTAASDASTAKTDASAAVTTANTASTNASTALSTAQTADSNASTALSTAQTADSNASAAVTTANTAASDATTAKNTANTAKSTADTAKATADKNVKESIQLWFTKANTTAPSKPSSAVTSNSTAGNAWRIVVPTYSSTYPYYYYCWQYKLADGTYTWSDVVYDRATTENQKNAHDALTQVSTKVETSTFNKVKNTVDSNSATITQLQTITTNNGLTENTNITQTINNVEQTVDSNSAHITNVVTTLGLAADGSSQSEDIVHKYNELDQTLDSTVSRVGTTESNVTGLTTRVSTAETSIKQNATDITLRATKEESYQMGQPNLAPFFLMPTTDAGYWYTSATLDGYATSLSDGWASFSASGTNVNVSPKIATIKLEGSSDYTVMLEVDGSTVSGNLYLRAYTANNSTWAATTNVKVTGDGTYRLAVKTKADPHASSITHVRLFFDTSASGASFAGNIRMSIYQGDYDGPYKPYSGKQLYASQAELKVANDNIYLKVSKNDVINQINVSTEGAKIEASKVEIDGTAIFTAISSDVDDAITDKGYQTSSQVSTAVSNGTANLAAKSNTVSRTQRIWYRKSASGAPSTPGNASSNWVTKADDGNDAWTKMHVAISKTHKYIYTCEQYEMANGTVGYTSVLLDNTITVIDGGNVITGSLKANAIDATSGTFDTANIPALTADHIKANVIDAVNNGTGTINADKINVSEIKIGDLSGEIGGRNLLRGTANPTLGSRNPPRWEVQSGGNGVGSVATISDSPVQDLTKTFRITGNTSGSRDFVQDVDVIQNDFGAIFRFSAYARGIGGSVTALIRSWNSTKGNEAFRKTVTVGTDWMRLDFEFVATSGGAVDGDRIDARFGITGAGSIEYIAPKLEHGSKATDWSPAPEDQAAYADEVASRSAARNLLPQPSFSSTTDIGDGWIHVYYSNPSSSEASHYWRLPHVEAVEAGKTYTIMIEIRNWVCSTSPTGNYMYIQQVAGNQFWGSDGIRSYGTVETREAYQTYIHYKDVADGSMCAHIVKTADTAHSPTATGYLFTYRMYTPAKSTNSFDIRWSLYEGDYSGPYKPYVNLDAAKTATNYIVADSNGIKIANANPSTATTYQHQTATETDFVVAGGVRNRINADGMTLYNGSGTADTNVVAKFTNELIELGKNSVNSIIKLCNGIGKISAYKGSTDPLDAHLTVESEAYWTTGNKHTTIYSSDLTLYQGMGAAIGGFEFEDEKTRTGLSNYSTVTAYSSGQVELEAKASDGTGMHKLQFDPTGLSINMFDTPIYAFYAGTKVVAPSNGSATLLTASEVQSYLDGGASQMNTICLVSNGDGTVWGGMMTGAMMQDGSAKVFVSPATTNRLRFNYILIRFKIRAEPSS